MSRQTQAFVLLLFGAALLRLGSGDLLLRFVRPSARPWVLIAGGAFLLLAVWTLVAEARAPRGAHRPVPTPGPVPAPAPGATPASIATADGGHGHDHGRPSRTTWLVLAPVLALLVVTPQALGAFSADRQRSVVSASTAATVYPPLPAGDPVAVTMYDFVTRAVLGRGETLRGRAVELTGFVARTSADGFVLARLIITCCAADASPVLVQVRAPAGLRAPQRNQWVQLRGSYAGASATDPDLPVLAATSVVPVAAPADPYG